MKNLSLHPYPQNLDTPLSADLYTDLTLYAHALGLFPSQSNLNRIEKALAIDSDTIEPVQSATILPGKRSFYVPSQTQEAMYTVEIYDLERSTCTCPDPNPNCKHTLAVRLKESHEMEEGWVKFTMDDESMFRHWTNIIMYP